MNISLVVQTCDHYEKYWDGFFYYMDKFWDKNIKCPKYFCTENKEISKKDWILIKTGQNTFVDNLKIILEKIESEYIFYMLEDFWPIQNFTSDLFFKSFDFIKKNNIKIYQISSFVPYYDLQKTNSKILNQNVFKFKSNSQWRFNFQTRFWNKEILNKNIKNPKISEKKINSCIDTEIESSKKLDKNIEVYFYHYFWYPLSGVSFRGNFTNLGNELKNNMLVDIYGKNLV